ncbi:UNVERIFIED_CONTAM: hypothetical protein DES50_101212 [Williamsia faeni]
MCACIFRLASKAMRLRSRYIRLVWYRASGYGEGDVFGDSAAGGLPAAKDVVSARDSWDV